MIYFLLAPLFSLCDRAWGGGLKAKIAGHGLAKPFSLLIFPACLALGLSWPLSLGIMLAFVAQRSPQWKLFGGSLAPHREEYLGTLLRHCLAPIAFSIVFSVYLQRFDPAFLILLPFPVIATLLAIYHRREANKGIDLNDKIELARGAVLGALVAVVLMRIQG